MSGLKIIFENSFYNQLKLEIYFSFPGVMVLNGFQKEEKVVDEIFDYGQCCLPYISIEFIFKFVIEIS